MIAVVIAGGLDPSGGAGLLADARALARHGLLARAALTARTVQGDAGLVRLAPTEPALLAEELAAALEGTQPPPRAFKVGAIGTPELAKVAAQAAARHPDIPLVWDPALAASRGGLLYEGPIEGLEPLLSTATLLTPNLAEAAALAGVAEVATEAAMIDAAHRIVQRGAHAVLVKGGHLAGEAADLLVTATRETWFRAARSAGPDVRGTGCALGSSIAAHLALGASLEGAVRAAKTEVAARIAAAHEAGERVLV